MTTEAHVEDIPAIIDAEASRRAENVAASAAAQIDQATKDAEAISRAAQQTELGARLQSMAEENTAWRASMETRLAETAAQSAAQAEALKASILESISTRLSPPPAVVEEPEIVPASVSDEPAPSSKQTDTTAETTAKRRRHVL